MRELPPDEARGRRWGRRVAIAWLVLAQLVFYALQFLRYAPRLFHD